MTAPRLRIYRHRRELIALAGEIDPATAARVRVRAALEWCPREGTTTIDHPSPQTSRLLTDTVSGRVLL
jgi:hypothetical protein